MLNDYYVIELSGKIDSNNAAQEEKRIFELLKENSQENAISFDASKLTYISSAGLRVLMKVKKSISSDMVIAEVSPDVYDIFEVTGFSELMTVKKKYREVSVDGCEIIGRGAYGTVYRLDEDTIVKKYESADAIAKIENEKRLAKIAFVAGIPTAISFDIVKIGDTYGSVFELIKSKTINDMLIANIGEADSVIKRYTDLIKQVHGISLEPGTLPSAKGKYLDMLERVRYLLPEEVYSGLKNKLNSIKDDDHVVHCDLQMKNIMLSGDEIVLIDMDGLSQGLPEFDFAGIFVAYKVFNEDEPDNSLKFFGISRDIADKIWDGVTAIYYQGKTDDEKKEIFDRILMLGYIDFLEMMTYMNQNPELTELRIKHTVEKLGNLCK